MPGLFGTKRGSSPISSSGAMRTSTGLSSPIVAPAINNEVASLTELLEVHSPNMLSTEFVESVLNHAEGFLLATSSNSTHASSVINNEPLSSSLIQHQILPSSIPENISANNIEAQTPMTPIGREPLENPLPQAALTQVDTHQSVESFTLTVDPEYIFTLDDLELISDACEYEEEIISEGRVPLAQISPSLGPEDRSRLILPPIDLNIEVANTIPLEQVDPDAVPLLPALPPLPPESIKIKQEAMEAHLNILMQKKKIRKPKPIASSVTLDTATLDIENPAGEPEKEPIEPALPSKIKLKMKGSLLTVGWKRKIDNEKKEHKLILYAYGEQTLICLYDLAKLLAPPSSKDLRSCLSHIVLNIKACCNDTSVISLSQPQSLRKEIRNRNGYISRLWLPFFILEELIKTPPHPSKSPRVHALLKNFMKACRKYFENPPAATEEDIDPPSIGMPHPSEDYTETLQEITPISINWADSFFDLHVYLFNGQRIINVKEFFTHLYDDVPDFKTKERSQQNGLIKSSIQSARKIEVLKPLFIEVTQLNSKKRLEKPTLYLCLDPLLKVKLAGSAKIGKLVQALVLANETQKVLYALQTLASSSENRETPSHSFLPSTDTEGVEVPLASPLATSSSSSSRKGRSSLSIEQVPASSSATDLSQLTLQWEGVRYQLKIINFSAKKIYFDPEQLFTQMIATLPNSQILTAVQKRGIINSCLRHMESLLEDASAISFTHKEFRFVNLDKLVTDPKAIANPTNSSLIKALFEAHANYSDNLRKASSFAVAIRKTNVLKPKPKRKTSDALSQGREKTPRKNTTASNSTPTATLIQLEEPRSNPHSFFPVEASNINERLHCTPKPK